MAFAVKPIADGRAQRLVVRAGSGGGRERKKESVPTGKGGSVPMGKKVFTGHGSQPPAGDGETGRTMRYTPESSDDEWSANMEQSFPKYMMSSTSEQLFCEDVRSAENTQDARPSPSGTTGVSAETEAQSPPRDSLWETIKIEVRREVDKEPTLSSFLYSSVLDNSVDSSLERTLSRILANRLYSATLLATQLAEIFVNTYEKDPNIASAMRADLKAVRERDPACKAYSDALLYFKGFHALEAYRVSHALWTCGRRELALMLQSRVSEVLSVDIHPGARIGKGILVDHGMGVVIGETAVVGDRVSILQGVTLGGTGKDEGDRHPKVGAGVLIGAHATILGNISIGDESMIAARSLVLKDVPQKAMVAGSPARVIGYTQGAPAELMNHELKPVSEKSQQSFCDWWQEAVRDQVAINSVSTQLEAEQ